MGLHVYGARFFTLPFYNPATFSFSGVFQGTSIAVLTYIGLTPSLLFGRGGKSAAQYFVGYRSGLRDHRRTIVAGVYAAQLCGLQAVSRRQVESAFPIVVSRWRFFLSSC